MRRVVSRALQVGRLGAQHTQARGRIRDDSRKRLVDLVGDGRCQDAETGDPGYVRQL
jgi:uncharacterized membrane-anchored protein